ncbi:hypothetical protein HPT27_02370 [Permianibacter sp. IMCC34836]|uniref:hypothetical protein n=1 Tax=Permianibacter fluminis TaxID=2738515 RepID=UPI0015528FD5|nr:hypothetical protein [Permianibacter fluminis]NQD35849.1 hypothetical protein [Permianibacter fluminis]
MLKWYLMAAAIAFAGYQWYLRQQNPLEIEHPVYVEYRMDIDAGGRTLNAVLFGKMVSFKECQAQADKIWRDSLADCEACQFESSKCQEELPKRYAGIFANERLSTSYIRFDRADRYERDGRMILWGMTDAEAQMVCEMISRGANDHYRGDVGCVVGGD